MVEVTKEQVVDYLSNLPVIQMAELVKELEGKWGVSAAPVAQAQTNAPVEEEVPEQTEFDVMLVSGGDTRIQVIKLVREITKKGLKESKDLVEACTGSPQVMQESVSKAEAEETIKKIEAAGGKAEMK